MWVFQKNPQKTVRSDFFIETRAYSESRKPGLEYDTTSEKTPFLKKVNFSKWGLTNSDVVKTTNCRNIRFSCRRSRGYIYVSLYNIVHKFHEKYNLHFFQTFWYFNCCFFSVSAYCMRFRDWNKQILIFHKSKVAAY